MTQVTYPLYAEVQDNKKVLIIDGFQNTASYGKEFLDTLRTVWDELLSKRNVMVILICSLISYTSSFSTDAV